MASEKEKLPGIKESQRLLNFESASRKVGFVILLGIILSALAGVFSGGHFSTTEKINTARSVKIDYERFGRLQTEFKLKISAQSLHADQYIFSLGGDFNKSYEIGSIWPRPDTMYSRGDVIYLVYNNLKSSKDFSVWLYVTPAKAWKIMNSIQLNAEPEIRFWQFIYP
ncbi:hypothetical protein [Brenneria tiliae]|uniref:hypothetical protein n=1 Tax=Brenneria tiliae TaxID=2914984 RepID=UPI00201496AA|nr:hypothetical protein [Brenneria tiliae]MCL2900324.1 hypothetical protein [Brenneria tiliae]MCL2904189.1 hypothetical protein [Brenneria tiliae]